MKHIILISALTLLLSFTAYAKEAATNKPSLMTRPQASQILFTQASPFKTIVFPSSDELDITADLYMPHVKTAPFIVLFHQAGWSRGGYREIAPKLNALGFNCMAIDLRSGGKVNGVTNETFTAAMKLLKNTTYIDAIPDMKAAIHYARKHYTQGKLLIWGSSYSSSLTLLLAGENTQIADAVLAFAPGEYFTNARKPANYIQTAASKIKDIPVFITSAKSEYASWKAIYDSIPSTQKVKFVPTSEGNHGSRALWEQFEDHQAYWDSVVSFLQVFTEQSTTKIEKVTH